jgi:hypothetical protein
MKNKVIKTKFNAPVSRRALLARVNRKLAHQEERLCRTRSLRAQFDLGDYYIEDTQTPNILDHHIDLELTAKVLGVLKPYERLADD